MRTTKKVMLGSIVLILVLAYAVAIALPAIPTPNAKNGVLNEAVLQSKLSYFTKAQVEGLSNQQIADAIVISPSENIIGAVVSNFSNPGGNFLQIVVSSYVVDITFTNVNITEAFQMAGSPKITATNLNVSENFESTGFESVTRIGKPMLNLTQFGATQIRFIVSGGSLRLVNCNAGRVYLDGFDNITIESAVFSGAVTIVGGSTTKFVNIVNSNFHNLTVSGDAIVTLTNTVIQEPPIHEIVVPEVTGNMPAPLSYNYLFEPTKQLEISWMGTDNIQGAAYGLTYAVTLLRDGTPVQTIYTTETHCWLTIDTSAANTVSIVATDQQGNASTAAIIAISTVPELLWFIIMIILIAAGAVVGIYLFYWYKQRQWQKTSLVEIPA